MSARESFLQIKSLSVFANGKKTHIENLNRFDKKMQNCVTPFSIYGVERRFRVKMKVVAKSVSVEFRNIFLLGLVTFN